MEPAFSRAPVPPRPCHNDLLADNFLKGADGFWLVEHENSGEGDPGLAVGNLSSNNGGVRAVAGTPAPCDVRRADRGASRATAADADHVRLPRGDVGRDPAGIVH